MLLTDALACTVREGANFELGPVMDGGWYWINLGDNSAVGNLIASDVLDNDPVTLTDAGDSITEIEGHGANLLMHTSGRAGLLPTILPVPDVDPVAATLCGFTGSGTDGSPARPRNTGCMLGDGKTMTLGTITDGFTGDIRKVPDKSSITRPKGTGSIELVFDLWGNGTGHYVAVHAADNGGISAMRGQPSVALGRFRSTARLTGVTYAVTRGAVGPGDGVTVAEGENEDVSDESAADDGLARSAPDDEDYPNAVAVTITSDSDYCSSDNDYDATVTVTASMDTADDADQVVPSVVRNASGVVGSTSFTVVCPAASANQGVDLVPDNPFPTD